MVVAYGISPGSLILFLSSAVFVVEVKPLSDVTRAKEERVEEEY